jgi:hypothetical protein
MSFVDQVRIVSRCSPVRRRISRCDRPLTKCSRRISTHCSIQTTSVLPSSLCAHEPRLRKPQDDYSSGPDFNRRRWPSFQPAPTPVVPLPERLGLGFKGTERLPVACGDRYRSASLYLSVSLYGAKVLSTSRIRCNDRGQTVTGRRAWAPVSARVRVTEQGGQARRSEIAVEPRGAARRSTQRVGPCPIAGRARGRRLVQ